MKNPKKSIKTYEKSLKRALEQAKNIGFELFFNY